MNKNIYNIIRKHGLHPNSYQKKKSVYIVDSDDKRVVIKLNSNYDIYKYLVSRDFLYFPNYFNDAKDDYDILEYIDDLSVSIDQKVNDYINVLALLHYKTSYKREIDLDIVKEKYETLTNRIVYLRDYYNSLNNAIDKEMFLSPAMYLLVKNISLIYGILNESLSLLNELYDKVKNEKSIRVALLHNNPDLDHLIIGNHLYLISWDKSYFDSPIYELEEFYRKYYQYIEISDFLRIYETTNKLSSEEKTLLLILLLIPKEIPFTNDTYQDTKLINSEINYLNKVYELLKNNKNN